MRVYNFVGSRRNLKEFYQLMWLSRGDQLDTNFTRGALYKIWQGKKRPKFSAIFNNFRV